MKVIISAALLVAASTALAIDESPAPEQQARALAKQFVGQLKPQLKQAMDEGGPAMAVTVCSEVAPAIADNLSAESGWTVKRVSLQPRNSTRAQPDEWERAVLYDFNRRQAEGEAPARIAFGEEVDGQYRFMQAQGVEPLCLLCHGKGLSDEAQAALDKYYPDDQATGYSLDQVRGAISLSRDL
jgi:hypothetical protein